MFRNRTTHLTPEQEAKATPLRERWRSVALLTQPIHPQQAAEAIRTAYALVGKAAPEIIFYDSPLTALTQTLSQLVLRLDAALITRWEHYLTHEWRHDMESEIARKFLGQAITHLNKQMPNLLGAPVDDRLQNCFQGILTTAPEQRLDPSEVERMQTQMQNLLGNQSLHSLVLQHSTCLHNQLIGRLIGQIKARMQSKAAQRRLGQLEKMIANQFLSTFVNELGNWLKPLFYSHGLYPERLSSLGSWLEFCILVLNCNYDVPRWRVFQSLMGHAGWIFPYEQVCIICNRPIKVSLDDQHQLHAEGSYALLYEDGYGLYFSHGVAVPKQYGQFPAERWKAEWILSERNAELRRILIQGIGYNRICAELDASELDEWQEYTLVKLDHVIDDIDGKPLMFVKMTCPSTQFTHIIRVPPTMTTARAAIRWVNWDIDPEQFALQS